MKKRLLSAFMALALCLTLLPTAAWAEEAENNIAVQANTANVAEVTIDGTPKQYTDIVAAFDAAQLAASATVKLLKNVTIPQNADSHSYGIRLKSGDITLDLNGCTIQTTGGESGFVPLYAVFYIEDGSSLTVQDSGNDGKIVQPNGGQAINVGSNGTLTVESGIIEVTSSDESNPTFVIMDKNCAVFLTGSGTANILDGTLTGKQGIYVKNGTLNVSGGTIHGKNSYALWVVGGSAALSGGTYTTGGENGCSIWNADSTAADLLVNGYRFESKGSESKYSDDIHGVVGNTTVAERPVGEFSYIGADGTEQTHAGCTELTADGFTGAYADTTTWFAANTDITADDLLQVRGTVNLILCDGVTVTLNKGIALNGQYTQPATLNIYAQSGGTGTLICSGPSDSGCAGIYDNSNEDGLDTALNIYGGNITATGSSQISMEECDFCGAGIGTSANDKYGSTMTVNISGGTVTAKSGGEGAAAIGQGANARGTVTVKIAPGMKCVKTDDQSTACEYGNTGGTSVTVTKCSEHVWEYTYTEDSSTHTKTCTLCGTVEKPEAHKAEKYVSVSESKHDICCVCGKKMATKDHSMEYYPNADGLTHKTSCKYCGWTSADEKHTFGENGVCVCGIEKSAEYNGTVYASLQAAVNAAAKAADGGTVTLARDVPENVTVTGGTLTVDLNGKTWLADISENPDIWGRIPLTVTGGSVTLENGTLDQGHTSSMGSYGIRIQGGSVTVKGNAVVIGSNTTGSGANISYPAIILESGDLTLETGAALVRGLEVPEGKTLSDYLPAGTAFRLRSYDEATGTLTEDNGLLNTYTIYNYAEHNMALVVVEHTKHEFARNSDGKYVCACGYVCPHNDFKDGKCTICGNGCAHKITESTDAAGNVTAECTVCGAQMAVKSETGGTVTYGTDFKAAMKAAENGTKITLLADVSISGRTGISGDNTTVTLDLNGHKITSGWLDVGGKDTNGTYTACTLKIIGKGSYEPPLYGGIITVNMKATLDLSEWEGGTISSINISDSSDYDAATREAAVIVGPKAGTIGKLSFGNNQLDKLKKTKLSGGSFNEIWVADFGPVNLGELLAEGYAYQYTDGVDRFVEYTKTLQGESIYNVKVVKCLHPNMKPDAATGMATCEYCGKSGNFVASVDGNLYTADQWKDAFKAWLGDAEDEKANGILKLYTDYEAEAADATWSVGYRPNGNTLDLNGHRMSVKNDSAFKPTNTMHLTVTDGTERGQIENILLDGSQRGSFTLESGYVCNLKMTDGAVVTLKGGSVDTLDVQNCSANTNISIQGSSIGQLNIKNWAEGMHVSATGGSLGAYTLPSGKILADVLDHQYYAEGTSLDRQVDATAQKWEQFVIKQAPHDFGSASKAANVPINGSIPFRVDSPSGDATGYYDVMWYRRTNSGAEHMTQNRVAGVNVNDTLDVFCVITGADRPGGTMQWQVAVKGYTINVVPAMLNGDRTVIRQKPDTGNTGNPADNRLVVTPFSSSTLSDVEYKFEVTYNGQPLELNKDYTIKDSSNRARNAGTYTLTIVGMGNYTSEKSVTWTLEPYELSVENLCHAQISKTYDGTDAVTDSTNGINELGVFNLDSKNPRNPILSTVYVFDLGKSDYQLSNMKFDSAEAGDRTFTGTMTLTSGGNFVFANGSRVMQIEYSGGSGRVSVSINRVTIADPAAKALQVANNHAAMYTVDLSALLPALEAPREYGAVTYGAPTVNLSSGYYTSGARVEDGKLILPIQAVNTETTGSIGSVQVKVSTTNYHDFTLPINVNATNKIVPTGEPTLSATTLTYGQALSAIKLSGKLHDNVNNKDVEGMFTWADGTVKPDAGSYEAAWKFTPTDGGTYAEADGTVSITVDKAKPTGEPIYTKITAANKTLKDANLKPNTSWPTGTIQWVDKDGKELPDTTEVKANTAYKWIFTPTGADAANYTTATGELTLYSVSTGGGSSSGSTVKTDTVTNPDGSVTKTETKSDGTVIETTTGKDGSLSKTETKKDGSSVTESKDAAGSTGTVKTDKNGQTTAETTLSGKAVKDAKKNGEAVKAPVEVEATRNSDTAPTVKVELPKGTGETKVEIPVSNATPGTVAVLVHADGTEEIVKDSIPTENGVQLTVNGDATVKVMDNSKNFTDTAGHWSEKNIDFVSARGLLNGTSANTFSPNAPTTRAQLWTVLARQADADLTGGANWYEKAQAWSTANGVSDGSDPNAAISRAQVVTMLWRAMGQSAVASGASFADVPADSYYAQAVAWAIENGITAGVGGGRFDPNSTCTRGQIATFLYRLYLSR